MKYGVIWHDCEDDRTGQNFKVEAPNIKDAYFKAIDEIKSWSPYLRDHFCSIDIECLVDENGKYHHPDFFLNKADKRFVILSGPSCVGKGSLEAATKEFYSEICYDSVPVIKSKESRPDGPRPDEVDKWDNADFFLPATDIKALANNPQYIVGECRRLLQAIDLEKITSSERDLILIEVYHTLGIQLKDNDYLRGVDKASIFLSPLSMQEIVDLKASSTDLQSHLTNLMAFKLAVRTRFQGKELTKEIRDDIFLRAEDTYSEVRNAHNYTHVVVSHVGEGDIRWHRNPKGSFEAYPECDARKTLETFVEILKTGDSEHAEHWPEDLLN